jgi:hypothetical protein
MITETKCSKLKYQYSDCRNPPGNPHALPMPPNKRRKSILKGALHFHDHPETLKATTKDTDDSTCLQGITQIRQTIAPD